MKNMMNYITDKLMWYILNFKSLDRYFAFSVCGGLRSLSLTRGQFSLFMVTMICTDFLSLALIGHFSNHSWTLFGLFYRFLKASFMCDVIYENVNNIVNITVSRSVVYGTYRIEYRTLPCGTSGILK